SFIKRNTNSFFMSTLKSGYVAIVGLPNAGKSTVLNCLLGQKLSIVTKKPQTTRKRILGILSDKSYQVVFIDTPGILTPAYLLQQKFLEYVNLASKDADLILLIIDIKTDPQANLFLANDLVKKILSNKSKKKIALINKIDLADENKVNKLLKKLDNSGFFNSIIPVSAIQCFNLNKVLDDLIELLPVGPKYYPDDQLTDGSERFFVSEIIREKVFEMFKDEIPYSTEIVIEEFTERKVGKDYISAVIYVERNTQKPIIIGKSGDSIMKLGKIARRDIEDFLERQVYLELRVKVKSKWRNNQPSLKYFGYDIPND
ncbi:GTPase Era, partial [Bacteroidota bacterium]